MANIFLTFFSRRWTLAIIVCLAVFFLVDMTTRYNARMGILTYKIKWEPPFKHHIRIGENSSETVGEGMNQSTITLPIDKTRQTTPGTATSSQSQKGLKKLELNKTVHLIRYELHKPVNQTTTTTTTTKTALETVAKETAPPKKWENSTIPGIKSMDTDLSLPPPVPVRADSKEPILHYSQKRDYPLLISHDEKCGSSKKLSDMKLSNFDYENDVFLLLVVKSACALKSRRDAIRVTWGNEDWAKENLHVNVRRVFLLGACQDEKLQGTLIAEDRKYNDILQWDFFDSFRNLTLKDCLFLQWITRNCQNVPYIFKGDDDVFVNVKNIVQHLKDLPLEKRSELFVGSVLNGSPRILIPSWKYYVSYNLYPDKFYPPYVSGGGFVMSTPLAVKLFQASLFRRIIPIDDAFLGILLKMIGVAPKNDRGFKSWGMKKTDPCRMAKIKTFHKMLPEQLIKTWKDFIHLDISTCSDETNDVLNTQHK
ncbi:UDP-GlcNAc:betaGal beta-1,3-N-acetylglucosaminyltransferase 7-like [Clavelina lepadiformis]|uniref:UDP-GlcNAc:betaGal beta-1,3-N-acetylglucosaminyltransferase 7-like n=1 Tax=Clavelina lepadiformis TaxID=159417 RepID=UPI0040434B12